MYKVWYTKIKIKGYIVGSFLNRQMNKRRVMEDKSLKALNENVEVYKDVERSFRTALAAIRPTSKSPQLADELEELLDNLNNIIANKEIMLKDIDKVNPSYGDMKIALEYLPKIEEAGTAVAEFLIIHAKEIGIE